VRKGKGFFEWLTKVSAELNDALGLCDIKWIRFYLKFGRSEWKLKWKRKNLKVRQILGVNDFLT